MCEHRRTQGDNYGETYMDCGAVLAGYGYGGWFGSNLKGNEQCKHRWLPYDEKSDICSYCERTRVKENPKKEWVRRN